MVGMTHFWRKAPRVLLLFVLTAPVAAQAPAATTSAATAAQPVHHASQTSRHRHTKSKPSPVPAPQPPPPPLTPEQMPPEPPQVTYGNGLLTIVATNSTLSDILRAVQARTGATLDAPPPLIGERVAARLGPATPREVLSELLSSPRFDYILVGADGDPNAVRSIILTANRASPSPSVAMAQPQPAPMPAVEDEDENDQVAPDSRTIQQPSPARRRLVQPQPPDQMAQPAPSDEGGNPQQPVKTPDQLLEQLRRMQQQQNYPQQQQQNNQR